MKGLNDDEICDFVQLTERKVHNIHVHTHYCIMNNYSLHVHVSGIGCTLHRVHAI